MSIATAILAGGAALGLGAGAAPFVGGVLSKPITGEVVSTRITDLVGYLTASGGGGAAKGLDNVGIGVDGEEISVAPDTSALRPAPIPGAPPSPPAANADSRRMLAVASLGTALAISFVSFLLIRRVLR